jgi:hypothetical protein
LEEIGLQILPERQAGAVERAPKIGLADISNISNN